MKIGFDVDGVLADYNSAFIPLLIRTSYHDLFPPRPFDIPTWDYPEYYGYTRKEIDAAWGIILYSSSFWLTLPAYHDTPNVLARLNGWRHTHAIYFITNRPGLSAKIQTECWLCDHGVDAPTVLISPRKDLCAVALQLDYYLDDKLDNAVGVGAVGGCRSFLLDRPWNRVTDPFDPTPCSYTRIDSIEEMLDEINRATSAARA